ncbi:hypothetical protein LTS07_010317 [Exophiala sideris]|uniref:DUF1746 domain-containing protein n=1 Tax=Exophiala sideris TaxID=1016849 RepID=A0ABR0J982_9EURO|nr:hypothetical protein LTS07_010317 [Exophiala sideris]KAK5037322.1 hypothetical protein LTR13_004478 [Exophiala sideris]KAK5058985.1 hypothetical protein LTR69_006272 [Exophiala sideris]KAK5182817.1 hypothetical protein LTR44_004525 [Eurotiomycetes sp. CCFEE 6388]
MHYTEVHFQSDTRQILILTTISAAVSSYCLKQLHTHVKDDVKQFKTGFQFFCINIVLYLSTYQNLFIALLLSTGAIRADDKVQTPELKVGLPATALCIEMGIVSLLHLWAYPSKRYTLRSKEPSGETTIGAPQENKTYQGGFLGFKAIWDALNIWDLLKAIGRGAKWVVQGRTQRHHDGSYGLSRRKPLVTPAHYQGSGSLICREERLMVMNLDRSRKI